MTRAPNSSAGVPFFFTMIKVREPIQCPRLILLTVLLGLTISINVAAEKQEASISAVPSAPSGAPVDQRTAVLDWSESGAPIVGTIDG